MERWVKGQRTEADIDADGGGAGPEWAMEGLLEKMNDQQIGQVWELYNAIRERGRDSVDEEDLVRKAEMEREKEGEKS